MNVNPINLNKNVNASQSQRAEKPVSSFEPEIQTSLYNTKGANVYFGSLAKGADVMEEQCVKILRAARDGMKRRFAENDIEDVLRILKSVKNSEEKPEIIKQVLTLDGEFVEKIPDRDMFKNLVKLIAQRPEHERFAILQFAENELQNSTKPILGQKSDIIVRINFILNFYKRFFMCISKSSVYTTTVIFCTKIHKHFLIVFEKCKFSFFYQRTSSDCHFLY